MFGHTFAVERQTSQVLETCEVFMDAVKWGHFLSGQIAVSYRQQLLERIETRTARLGIVGLGYVGLPLAVEFARAGLRVLGVDLDPEKVGALRRGESYIQDVPGEVVKELVEREQFIASADYAALRDADAVCICAPTPLTPHREPDMSFVIRAADGLRGLYHPGQLIALESTVYPGATEEVFLPRLQAAGLTVGEDVFLVFSPERIDPGNQRFGVRNTAKVVGGATPACLEVARALYALAVETLAPVSSLRAAEVSKLLENTFRAVNISFVNEMALMCEKLGVNVWEVIEAAATKPYGFMKFTPGPGIGGHCIPLDPLYLSWKMRSLGYTARFIELADKVNLEMPQHVVSLVMSALNDAGKALKDANLLILGVAYKKDIDDLRESPALEVMAHLRRWQARVSYHDPHVPRIRQPEGGALESIPLTAETLRAADCVLVLTDHSAIDWAWVRREARLIVDTRNALKGTAGGAQVVTL
jgi:UDP-N-acetyl-D-glucosamine dehydrogenase